MPLLTLIGWIKDPPGRPLYSQVEEDMVAVEFANRGVPYLIN